MTSERRMQMMIALSIALSPFFFIGLLFKMPFLTAISIFLLLFVFSCSFIFKSRW